MEEDGYIETFAHEVDRIVWWQSKELYGVIPKEGYKFEVKRWGSSNQAVFEVSGKVTQFSFMDEKGLRSVVGYEDGNVEILSTEDGKILHNFEVSKQQIVWFEILEHKKQRQVTNFSACYDKIPSIK